MSKLVFICSPYRGDIEANVERAREYCARAVTAGAVPIAPHLLFPQFIDEDTDRETGLSCSIALLEHCAELWFFGMPTEGMMGEIIYAVQHQIPVYCKCA